MLAIRRLAEFAATRFATFGDERRLTLDFRPSIDDPSCRAAAEAGNAETTQAVVARAYAAQLQDLRRDELRRGVSLVGPHRDDFALAIDGIDVATYGSAVSSASRWSPSNSPKPT